MKVKDVMSKTIVSVSGMDSVASVAKLMKEKNLHGVMVDRRDEDDAYGMISQRNIVFKVLAEQLDPEDVPVHKVMTKPCITVNPSLNVVYAARLMANTGINRAPVIEEHKLLGIISIRDLMTKTIG